MEDENSRAGDRENKSQEQLEKTLKLVVGLESKVNDVESIMSKLEEDDMSTVASTASFTL